MEKGVVRGCFDYGDDCSRRVSEDSVKPRDELPLVGGDDVAAAPVRVAIRRWLREAWPPDLSPVGGYRDDAWVDGVRRTARVDN